MAQTGKKTTETITPEKLLTSVLMINQLLVRPVSIDKVLNAIVAETQKIWTSPAWRSSWWTKRRVCCERNTFPPRLQRRGDEKNLDRASAPR